MTATFQLIDHLNDAIAGQDTSKLVAWDIEFGVAVPRIIDLGLV